MEKPPTVFSGDERVDGTVPDELEEISGLDDATLDDKNRLSLPRKQRTPLGESFTIGVGTAGCLVAYPRPVWRSIIDWVKSVEPTNLGREIYQRLIVGQSEPGLKCDSQGRVVIPQKLREMANIRERGQVVLVGCVDRLEIWAKEEYEKYMLAPLTYGEGRREQITKAMEMMKR